MMHKYFAFFLALSFISTFNTNLSAAQEPKGWMINYDYASEISKKQNKPLIILFTGSDWCHYCIKLRQEIIDKKKFQNWSKNKAIFYYCDFPQNSRQSLQLQKSNQSLAKKYSIKGFPTTVVLTPSGKVIGKIIGYSDDFIKELQALLAKSTNLQDK